MHIPARRRFISLALVMGAGAAGFITSRADTPDGNPGDKRADGLAYGDTPRQRLDVYAPDGSSAAARPVVVYLYGGSWQGGQRRDSRGVGQALASRGIVTIAPDYRLYPETVFPGFVDDTAAAVRWTRDHARAFGGDPQRISVMGHSAGAHIAALVASDPRYLAAHGMSKHDLRGMIGLAGPYVALPPDEPHIGDIFPAALRRQALPIDVISGNEPPMLLATGTADTVVDPENSVRFATALREHDDTVELKQYAGCTHDKIVDAIAAPQGAAWPVLDDVIAFIEAH
ncbi:alpha/beta hydrolase [Caballeronia hypogeia]|uniref:Alpha/beta hydrolase n=1 Tax=Caballeronia hypogeia TaxID=1777140 RepID=A0A158A1F5_9BURK|nr:alpha/beta hydrolase [Caballeronia hypogeia]SAK50927.1 alpha/beta hydrolase [Caballeronia hypogeia]